VIIDAVRAERIATDRGEVDLSCDLETFLSA
jgi:hypothetical protein